MRDTGVPVAFGVLTTDDFQQAMDRAGGAHGNKGYDVALAGIEMARLCAVLPDPPKKILALSSSKRLSDTSMSANVWSATKLPPV